MHPIGAIYFFDDELYNLLSVYLFIFVAAVAVVELFKSHVAIRTK